MSIINLILGIPLGYIMYFCYSITQHYGVAIIMFTILMKIIFFPLSIAAQKNSVRMAKLQPKLDEIKKRYSGDSDKIAQEQIYLYKNEKYSPIFGLVPLLIQIPLILGLINVVYNPLQHLLHLSGDMIETLAAITEDSLGITLGWGRQLQIIDAIRSFPDVFRSLQSADNIISSIENLRLSFAGINLSMTPSLLRFDSLMLIPAGSGLSAFLLCLVQNKIDLLQKRQSVLAKTLMTLFMIGFGVYFTFIVPAGVGLYWIAGNLLTIVVTYLCNRMYTVVDMGRHTQKKTMTKEEKIAAKEQKKTNRLRARMDGKRFFADENDNKQLVFYSQASGFYKYFRGLIEYITQNSDIIVHYVTSDPDDKIFDTANKQIIPYYGGSEREIIGYMMKMDADMVVMTMPDLDTYHIKRSYLRKDIEYVFLDHGMTSFHLMYREGALDNYDTIFCYSPNHIEEVRETEKAYGLPAKNLVKTGYGLLDEMLAEFESLGHVENNPKRILVAPSWQVDNIMELCIDEIIEQLAGKGFRLTIRPHPEFVKRFPDEMQSIIDRYATKLDDDFIIQTDFSSNETVFQSDLVITDWSSIAQEFSYATKKPSLFINTPMKIMNPEYKRIPCIPLDISLRDEIGISLDVTELGSLFDTVSLLLENKEEYRQRITDVLNRNIFNIGCSDKVAGDYIINALG